MNANLIETAEFESAIGNAHTKFLNDGFNSILKQVVEMAFKREFVPNDLTRVTLSYNRNLSLNNPYLICAVLVDEVEIGFIQLRSFIDGNFVERDKSFKYQIQFTPLHSFCIED